MIIPSFRLYHFAVKLIWKRMLVLTLLFWLGVTGVYYVVNSAAVWHEYGWWLPLMVAGTDVDDDAARRKEEMEAL